MAADWRRAWWFGCPCRASGDVSGGVFGESGTSALAVLRAAREGAYSARDFSLPGRLAGEGGREGMIDRPPVPPTRAVFRRSLSGRQKDFVCGHACCRMGAREATAPAGGPLT